jgi:hypothetical protein
MYRWGSWKPSVGALLTPFELDSSRLPSPSRLPTVRPVLKDGDLLQAVGAALAVAIHEDAGIRAVGRQRDEV